MTLKTPARAWLFALFCGVAAVAQPAAFPDRNVLMVVAGSPGGGLDLTGRALEQTMLETRLHKTGFV